MTERQTTEAALKNWRFGPTQAERLTADILVSEKYESVDPQLPLGGPDSTKDILCKKKGKKWVVACYFPQTPVTIRDIQKKLTADAKGVKKNKASGIIFFVNQYLTPAEKSQLSKSVKFSSEIYHLERLRTILDTPRGYGIRLEYLRIPMNNEEQLGLWSEFKNGLSEDIEGLHKKLDELMYRTNAIHTDLRELPSSLITKAHEGQTLGAPTSLLSVELVLWLHRTLMEGSPVGSGFRKINVWIGSTQLKDASFVPISHDRVVGETTKLLENWRLAYVDLSDSTEESKLYAIADFHHNFLKIHPFLDGNGRIARCILQQQVAELLGKEVHAVFTEDPLGYYSALTKANASDLKPLISLIGAAVE